MKSVKLTLIKTKSLSEIFQSLDIKFAFVNRKMEEVSVPAKCRDFLGDCIYSRKKKQSVYIYGFNYDYTKTPFDDCRLSLRFPDKGSYTNFINNINYLHEREKQAGVKLTKIFTTDKENTLVVEGSNYWTSAVWKISLYTFYLKLISYKTVADVQSPENTYVKELTPTRESAMLSKVKSRVTEKYDPKHTTNTIHDSYGFFSILIGYAHKPNIDFVLGVS